jgi:excisionase family DNA binding protein
MESPKPGIEPRYFTPIEVAALLGVTRPTVLAWLRNPEHPLNAIKVNKMWRIPESSLKAFLEAQQ